MAGSYRDLRVWQNAMDMVECVYGETRGFPREEIYGLTSQMRRRLSRFQVTSRKAKGDEQTETDPCSSVTLAAHFSNWKLRY
jgi:23S rRNA-intervening sequence protein